MLTGIMLYVSDEDRDRASGVYSIRPSPHCTSVSRYSSRCVAHEWITNIGGSVEGYDVIAAGIWQTVSRTAFRYAARDESGAGSAKNGRTAELRGIGENLITALKTLVSGLGGLRIRVCSA